MCFSRPEMQMWWMLLIFWPENTKIIWRFYRRECRWDEIFYLFSADSDEKTRKSGFYTFVYRNNVKWGLGKFCFYIAQSFNNADVWSICLIIVWFLQFLAYIYINTSFFNRLQVGKYYSFPCQKWIWRGSSWVVGFESAWKKTKNVSGESWTLHIQW